MSPHSSGTIAAPVNPRSILPENNELDIFHRKQISQPGYDPASVWPPRHASKVSHQPSFFEAKEPLRRRAIRDYPCPCPRRDGAGLVARDSELDREVPSRNSAGDSRRTPPRSRGSSLEAQVTGKPSIRGLSPFTVAGNVPMAVLTMPCGSSAG
ncbi:MAG: hypothetical protein U0798_01825 [Gemmataceae bacterium]